MTPPGKTPAKPDTEPAEGGPILLFDGECNLCNATVQFIIRHDRKSLFRFASLQGNYGRRLLASLGMPGLTPDTFLADPCLGSSGVNFS